MRSHVFHEILIHLNWLTRHDQPLLPGRAEELAHRALRDKALEWPRGYGVVSFGW